MARLTKTERLGLQAHWIIIWRFAGRPNLERVWEEEEIHPYSVSIVGKVFDSNGEATGCRMRIWLDDHDLTPLFCRLTGRRLRRDGSVHYCSEGYFYEDCCDLAQDAFFVHREAAIAHRNIEALAACGREEAIETEAAWLSSATAPAGCQSRQPRRI